jgi:hypothetical protein
LELEIEIGFQIGSSSGTRNEPRHGSGTGTRIFENTHSFGGIFFLELLVNWLITIGFRPVYPEPETNLILELQPESKPELYFFQEPNQNQNRNYFNFFKKNQNSQGFS